MIIALYFKPKKKTTCKFKRRPETGEEEKQHMGRSTRRV